MGLLGIFLCKCMDRRKALRKRRVHALLEIGDQENKGGGGGRENGG